MNFLMFFVVILMLIELMLVKCLNRMVLFFIIGLEVNVFKFLSFKIVVLLEIMVIVLFLEV